MPSMSLELVVVAIVVLVVALVVLAIFGAGITPFGQITNAKNTCTNNGRLTCTTSGQLPSTWATAIVFTDPTLGPRTCAQLLPGCSCTAAVGNNYQWNPC